MTMKMCASGLRLLAGILLLMPAAAFGAGAVVDCSGATPGAFTSINAALASLHQGYLKPLPVLSETDLVCKISADEMRPALNRDAQDERNNRKLLDLLPRKSQ